MADDSHNTSEVIDAVGAESPKEDAATKATREELKHTVISDAPADTAASTAMDEDKSDRAPSAGDKTPDLKPSSVAAALKEQVSSPKKKRAHDEVEEGQEVSISPALSGCSSPRDSNGASRGERLEPEKKRVRDEPEEETKKSVEQTSAATTSSKNTTDSEPKDATKTPVLATEKADDQQPISASEKDGATAKPSSTSTSASAFAKSGFAKLTGAASPFGALGAGAAKSGGFGGSLSNSPSPFGALGTGPTPVNTVPKLTFATPAADKSGPAAAASPFAALNGGPSKTFGSAFGSGFGSGLGASKLTSFAKPGGDLKDTKPARPFGAPESDNEGSSDGGDDEEEPEIGTEEPESEKESEESKQAAAAADDKKKTKLQKVVVDDGEAGETTVFVARAKVYYMDSVANAWKERGAGLLKINVPEATVDTDDHGVIVPESFDASMLLQGDDEGEDVEAGSSTAAKGFKVVRLIMRQDHTHRVVVNAAVTAATDFVKREMLRAATFTFNAVEGPEAMRVTLQIKMSPPNAEQFHKVIELIQKELKSLG